MLNKLLKRCMPWMDKGRWYHVTIDGSSESEFSVKYDNIFSSHEIIGGTRKYINILFTDPAPKMAIIDTKVILHIMDESYVINGAYFTFEIEAAENGIRIQIPVDWDGDAHVEYWFFIEKG